MRFGFPKGEAARCIRVEKRGLEHTDAPTVEREHSVRRGAWSKDSENP